MPGSIVIMRLILVLSKLARVERSEKGDEVGEYNVKVDVDPVAKNHFVVTVGCDLHNHEDDVCSKHSIHYVLYVLKPERELNLSKGIDCMMKPCQASEDCLNNNRVFVGGFTFWWLIRLLN